ncbi:hypothetical protein ABZ860_42375 [Microbispora sp. NPDC046973]|uniref:hypothetical protein n=1 Tax=Microbispora sp. NPDC046973 TaxID=3155022 RepID=UPI0033F7228A
MKGRIAALVVVSTIAVGALMVGGSVLLNRFGSGCPPRNEQLAGVLASLSILGVHPPTAQSAASNFGCEEDDGYALAWQSYKTGDSLRSVEEFYTRAALEDGWTPQDEAFAELCFTKMVLGTKAYLSVAPFDPYKPESGSTYTIEVVATRDGDMDMGC